MKASLEWIRCGTLIKLKLTSRSIRDVLGLEVAFLFYIHVSSFTPHSLFLLLFSLSSLFIVVRGRGRNEAAKSITTMLNSTLYLFLALLFSLSLAHRLRIHEGLRSVTLSETLLMRSSSPRSSHSRFATMYTTRMYTRVTVFLFFIPFPFFMSDALLTVTTGIFPLSLFLYRFLSFSLALHFSLLSLSQFPSVSRSVHILFASFHTDEIML